MKFDKVILASQSPRRKELLKIIFDNFEVLPSGAEETVPKGTKTDKYCEYLALLKARDIAQNYRNSLVIGADTAVVLGEKILGKPKTREEAYNMLKLLSGKTHYVYTGCALILGDKSAVFTVKTDVTFYELDDREIYEYIDTGDCFDKAGGYGIQTKGSMLVKEIKGDYFNVVGLPIAQLKREIENFLSFKKF